VALNTGLITSITQLDDLANFNIEIRNCRKAAATVRGEASEMKVLITTNERCTHGFYPILGDVKLDSRIMKQCADETRGRCKGPARAPQGLRKGPARALIKYTPTLGAAENAAN
jgi:hypothetical protein